MPSTPTKSNEYPEKNANVCSAPSNPKATSVNSIPDAEVKKPLITSDPKTDKKPMSEKMKEEAKEIAQLMAEQEKEAKAKGLQRDNESLSDIKKLIGKPNTLNEKQFKPKEGANEERKKTDAAKETKKQ